MSDPALRLAAVDVDLLAESVDHQDWGAAAYFDPSTGEVHPAGSGEVMGADGPMDASDGWVAVGGASSREAYRDMAAFAAAVGDPALAGRLNRVLEGRGAFRRFRDVLHRDADETVGRAWSRFDQARRRGRALEWLRPYVIATELDAADEETSRAAEAALQEVRRPAGGARLVHLNDSGAAASEVAHRFAAERPGMLCADPAILATLLGGSPHDHGDTPGRLAMALAAAHLADGGEVVLPLLVAGATDLDRLEELADAAGADLVEVVLHGSVVGVERRGDDGGADLADVATRRRTHRLALHPDPDVTLRDLAEVLDPDVPA